MGWSLHKHLAALLAALWVFEYGRTAYNQLVAPPLPAAYFAYGNGSTCDIIQHDYSEDLGFCEDLALWKTHDVDGKRVDKILASCDLARHEWNTVMGPMRDPKPRGSIWLLQNINGRLRAQPVRIDGFPSDLDFHPLGLDIVAGPEGPPTVFIVNHMRTKRTVELFELHDESSPRLIHLRQLEHPSFRTPNSVAAVSPSTFFLSNDHGFTRDGFWPLTTVMHFLETLLFFPLGSVELVQLQEDGISAMRVASGIAFANGLALSPDGSELAVASTSPTKVHLYAANTSTGQLIHKKTLRLPYSPDNLHYHDDSSLLVAGHPHFPGISLLARRKRPTSPSWVTQITKREHLTEEDRSGTVPYSVYKRVSVDNEYAIKTLYQSNGTGWSAVTTALWSDGSLVMSGLYTRGILVCSQI